ncbi:MAG: DUF805 domain-containing protein [Bacteroidota bacterium]
MFQNPFSFDGRIRRLEYGLSALIYFVYVVIAIVLMGVFGLMTESGGNEELLYFYLICSPAIYFYFAQGAKRCHDRNNSGWYMFVPFYGFWMLFADGDIGPNDYGDNPKGLVYDDEEDTNVPSIDDVDEDGIIKSEKNREF